MLLQFQVHCEYLTTLTTLKLRPTHYATRHSLIAIACAAPIPSTQAKAEIAQHHKVSERLPALRLSDTLTLTALDPLFVAVPQPSGTSEWLRESNKGKELASDVGEVALEQRMVFHKLPDQFEWEDLLELSKTYSTGGAFSREGPGSGSDSSALLLDGAGHERLLSPSTSQPAFRNADQDAATSESSASQRSHQDVSLSIRYAVYAIR